MLQSLVELENANYLSEFYVSREYPKMAHPESQDENHLRIGLREPYSPSHLREAFREVEQAVREPEQSPEWNEIEELKALATRAVGISNDRLGEVGKIAHIIHHFFNASSYVTGEGMIEGARLLSVDND
jgi:hypothetical protein